MVRTAEVCFLATALLRELCAAMCARVMQGSNLPVLASDDEEGCSGKLDLAAYKTTRLGQFANVANVDPAAHENGFALKFIPFGIVVVPRRYWVGSKTVRIFCGFYSNWMSAHDPDSTQNVALCWQRTRRLLMLLHCHGVVAGLRRLTEGIQYRLVTCAKVFLVIGMANDVEPVLLDRRNNGPS